MLNLLRHVGQVPKRLRRDFRTAFLFLQMWKIVPQIDLALIQA